MINRSAITVRAKQPFLDWLRKLPDPVSEDLTLARINDEPHVYLLPEYEMMDEQEKLLRYFFHVVFENELRGWWTIEADWPNPRNFKLFQQWFDVKFHSIIIDLVDDLLIDED